MLPNDSVRVVIDTNIWISSLIGRQLAELRSMLSHPILELITTPHLIEEIELVTQRPKFRKYFHPEDVAQLVHWMHTNMTSIELGNIPHRCRDAKDDYLLELAVKANAIYLVSGDEDLLSLGNIENCKIMTVSQFLKEWEICQEKYRKDIPF